MIFQGDVIIREAILRGLQDIRLEPWLIDDIFSQFKHPALSQKYGDKEIQNAKDWFSANQIEVNLRYRNDKDQFPCVTIALGSSVEKDDLKTLGDLTAEVETLLPETINKPIKYILAPFVPESYDQQSGELKVPSNISMRGVRPGQILVDPTNGSGVVIQGVQGNTILLEEGLDLELTKAGVVPKFQIYKARRESSKFQENYSIGCHVHGDPSTLLWLHSIVCYSLLRYRESLLEGMCFDISSFSSTDLAPNQNFEGPGGEMVFSRYINLTGQVENSWLKSPQRIIEAVEVEEVVDENAGLFKSGIKIISNLDSPEDLDTQDQPWTTIKDSDQD